MDFLFKKSNNLIFRFYGVRFLVSIAVILIYLILWRPVRVFTTEQLVYPQVQKFQEEESDYRASMQGGALVVNYVYYDEVKELHYRPQFGFFLLLALIPLLFITKSFTPYWMLAVIHLLGSLFAYISLIAGAAGLSVGFVLTDIINGYLVPALSLALVPLAMSDNFFEK